MDAEARLDSMIDKFDPEVAALGRTAFARLKARIPGATMLVYDNYNALAIGFGASGKPSKAVLSLVFYVPGRLSICFIWGAGLPDPHGLLQGGGSQVRFVRLETLDPLDDPRVDALITEALARSEPPFDPAAEQTLVIQSVSAKQRPRRKEPA